MKRRRRPNIPTELCQEILLRLPVKSLLRFLSVSKTWRALIHDREFASSHLVHAIENRPESQTYVFRRKAGVTKCEVRCNKTSKVNNAHHMDSLKKLLERRRGCRSKRGEQDWDVVGSIHGLFMLRLVTCHRFENCTSKIDELMLWNPSIRKVHILPPPPQIETGVINMNVGLGLDPSTKDYKLVRFVLTLMPFPVLHSVSVYTLGTNSWKANTLQGKGCPNWRWALHSQRKTVCFRGVLYILAKNQAQGNPHPGKIEVVSYDLSNEEFNSSNLPGDETLGKYYYPCWDLVLAKDGSSLALVYFHPRSQGSIWLADGFGAGITWIKCYTLDPAISSGAMTLVSTRFSFLTKDDEEILVLVDGASVGTQHGPFLLAWHGEHGTKIKQSQARLVLSQCEIPTIVVSVEVLAK